MESVSVLYKNVYYIPIAVHGSVTDHNTFLENWPYIIASFNTYLGVYYRDIASAYKIQSGY